MEIGQPQPTALELVTSCFLNATRKIESIYFQLKVAGIENPKYLERVYCYELYHQMRLYWPKVPHKLTGEIDKGSNPRVREGVLNRSKPDFTIHVPGDMEDNLLVIEVKARDPVNYEVQRDLQKLSEFRRSAQYEAAYYLTYGFNEHEASEFAATCLTLAESDDTIDLSKIILFNQSSAGIVAAKIPWQP
jgi:hypothetical protein